jgi:hypothetical protein
MTWPKRWLRWASIRPVFCLENFAAESYRAGKMTMEQVIQLLGSGTRMQVDAFLQAHGIYDYTLQDLEKDIATLERLESARS